MLTTIDLSRTEKDWILGGLGAFVPQKINPAGDWRPYFPPFKLQRATDGDTDACTVFSAWNALRMIAALKGYGDLQKSESFTAVDAGNIRGLGNSFNNTDESIRTHWSVPESEKPFTTENTLDQFYAPNTDQMQQDALKDLVNYTFMWGWLTPSDSPTVDEIKIGLQESPIRCAVQGNYSNRDAQGRILNIEGASYNHAVDIACLLPDGSAIVYDSETMSYDIFAPGYLFMGCKVFSLEKKTMNNLYKKNGQSAIGLFIPDNGGIVLFADGMDVNGKTIAGGSVFKAAGWAYADAQHVDEWPYPIVGEFTEVPKTI